VPRLEKSPKLLLYVFACSLLAFVLLFNTGADSRVIKELYNFGHVIVFGLIAVTLSRTIGNRLVNPGKYAAIWIITMILGLLVEIIQLGMKGRNFELGDLLNDALGSLAFLMLFSQYENRLKALIVRLISVMLIVIAGLPFYTALADGWLSRSRFPVINSFENAVETSSWIENGARIERLKQPAGISSYSAKITLLPGEYPGLCKEDFIGDWKSRSIFAIDVFLPGDDIFSITVRINDRNHNEEFNDRFNRRFNLRPGWNKIRISLRDIENAPQGRRMNMAAITRICIFGSNLTMPREVYLDNLRLE
jgi:VanZ family protein